jgi:hypothetical protein
MTEKNVATYEQSEAVAIKEPTVFQEFTYDNESNGGVLNQFTEIDAKITEVKGFINQLSDNYKTMVEKYDAFTNLSEQMDAIITTMNSRADNVAKYFNNIITSAEQAVEEHAKTDKNLMDDLDVLQGMLATGVGTEAGFKNNASLEAAFRASHNGYSREEFNKLNDIQKEQVAKEAAKHDDKINANKEDLSGTSYDNMNKGDLEAIADDIIKKGNYGNGKDRYAELEEQGYDALAVQDIVNKKMKGVWESGDPEYAQYVQIDGAKSAEAAQKIHDAQVRGRERTEAAQAAAGASTGTQITRDTDPVSAAGAAEAGYVGTNPSKSAAEQAQERGIAQTEYYKKMQSQQAVQQAHDRGVAQTEYYKNMQNQQAAQQSTQQAIYDLKHPNVDQPSTNNVITGNYIEYLEQQGKIPESMTQNNNNNFYSYSDLFQGSINNQTPPATNWQPDPAMVENMNNAVGIGSGVGGGANTAKEVDR